MATVTRQFVGTQNAGITSVQVNITSSLSGSILVAFASSGGNSVNVATDSGGQTYTNALPDTLMNNTVGNGRIRCDHILNSAAGVTSVTVHISATGSLAGMVAELTGTANAVRGSIPAVVTGSSTSAATNTVTAQTGDIAIAVVGDDGATNTVYTVTSPFTMSTYTPSGTTERGGGANSDNMAAQTTGATFTLPASAPWATGIILYQTAGGGVVAGIAGIGRWIKGGFRGPENFF